MQQWSPRQVVAVAVLAYAIARAISALLMSWAAGHQSVIPGWTDSDPSYLDLANFWDGRWYGMIADEGYPKMLPTDEHGRIAQNQWAFYPLFPMTGRLIMTVTGLSWSVVGPTLSLLLGAAAAAVMAVLVRERIGNRAAVITVSLWSVFPAAPSLQMSYSESAAALVLVSFLLLLQRRHWLWAGVAALVMGVTRPIGAPLILAFGLAAAWEWYRLRKDGAIAWPFYLRTGVGLLCTVVGAFLWQVVMALVTGVPDGYMQTQAAWRTGNQVTIFEQWPRLAAYFLKWTDDPEVMGWLVVIGFVLLISVQVAGPWASRLGPANIAWVVGYLAYLLAIIEPFTSLIRYLLMFFPLGAVAAGVADQRDPGTLRIWTRTAVVALVFLALQVWWVRDMVTFNPPQDYPP